MTAADGKKREIQSANIEGLLRLIQSIPSPKAEPFKRWLAQVGYERLQEIENPELAARRMREIYRQKGYSEAWIEKRMRGIAVRDELTDEWKKRGVKEHREYAILTAEISKATFGMTPSQYREHKALTRPTDNLRDHMTDLELIFTMLGEASTTEIARNTDARGFPKNKQAARAGGTVAGNARKELERKSGQRVSTRGTSRKYPKAVGVCGRKARKRLERSRDQSRAHRSRAEGGGLGCGRRQPHPARVSHHTGPHRRSRAARQTAHGGLRAGISQHQTRRPRSQGRGRGTDRRRWTSQELRWEANRPLHLFQQRQRRLRNRHGYGARRGSATLPDAGRIVEHDLRQGECLA